MTNSNPFFIIREYLKDLRSNNTYAIRINFFLGKRAYIKYNVPLDCITPRSKEHPRKCNISKI